MTTITITISIDAGPEAQVSVGQARQVRANGEEAAYVPPFEDELIPLPDGVQALPGDVNVQPGFAQGAAIAQPVPFRGSASGVVPDTLCPVHNVPWKSVPAGVSKSSGKPYGAFWGCSSPGKCSQRPSPQFVSAHPLSA